MSVMTRAGVCPLLAPERRLLFAENPVISDHEGQPTLMIRLANERHQQHQQRQCEAMAVQEYRQRRRASRFARFYELPLSRNESPAAGAELDPVSRHRRGQPLYDFTAEDLETTTSRSSVVVPDTTWLQAANRPCPQTYEHPTSASVTAMRNPETTEDGRLRSITAGSMRRCRTRACKAGATVMRAKI